MHHTPPRFELPRVGVVITSHNYRNYIEDAIRSVLAQTYEKWDCVIVDDASTDGSADHIRRLLEAIGDPRFSLLVRSQNGGQLESFRDGFAAGDAPFVAFLDSDDIWLPNFLVAHLAAHLNATRPASLSSSDVFLVDRDRTLLAGTYIQLRKPRSKPDTSGAAITPGRQLGEMAPEIAYASDHPITHFRPGAYGWMWAPTSSMVFRRGALEPVLAFPFKARIGTDYLAATCAHLEAGSLILSECLGLYRLHGANASTNITYAGGHVQQSPVYRAQEMTMAADVVDYVVANAERLSVVNGQDFVPGFLSQHVRRFGSLGDDPRVMPFLDRRSRLRRRRKRFVRALRRLFGGPENRRA
ncbi:glycosyltransferase [Mesorhizobium helmanticense]|uniref:Glycosyl transferase family 2 n=1 Tax=Mesorhizobium helmanticense TaxID=1776423 RepID=A0A2T4IU47_9HYPH|nr:glycosyltransferase [Mesorhizobium helmanticense]PTE09160.1 glycosyl transferase family 2 [Mesorhizobium helmanticense]